jgi:hypothetical protein
MWDRAYYQRAEEVVPGSPPVITDVPLRSAFGFAPGFVEVLVAGVVMFLIWRAVK